MIPYLQVEGLTRRWGDLVLFEDISFTIAQGQKVALIAKNGAGKSTLLNTITGKDLPDDGKITFTNDVKVGYLLQSPDLNPEFTVMQEVYNSTSEIVAVIKEYEANLTSNDQTLLQASIEKMDLLSAWDFDVKIKQILTQLKITHFDQKIKELSGGQQKRVALANILINNPDFLILDEPTNHLDLDMIEWLEEYLQNTQSTLFMVTHDRYFLDRVCNEILEIDRDGIHRYKGNYSYFVEKQQERHERLQSEIDKARNLLRTEQEWMRRMPKARGGKAKYRIDSFHELKKKAFQNLSEDELELNIKASRLGKKIIETENLSKSFDDLCVLNNFTYKFSRFEKVGIVGENGTGKSTFLNLITGTLQADNGKLEIGETVKFGYYKQEGIRFNPDDKVIDVVREIAEVVDLGKGNVWTASQLLTHFLFPNEVQYTTVQKLSGGEKRRLYLCTILMQNPNFLILDEPTNDLDIMTLNVLEDYLLSFNGCVIIVSHDRYFMDKVVDHIFAFEAGGNVKDFPGNYTIYRDYKDEKDKKDRATELASKKASPKPQKPKSKANKLSFNEKRELEQLEQEMETLNLEKAELETELNSGELDHIMLQEKANRFAEIKDLIDEKEFRWLELSDKE